MVQEKMTITEALTELKLLDKRIQKAINECVFIGIYVPRKSAQSELDIADDIRSTYQSAKALIARRNAIKNAVVLSNATTKVVVGDTSYTVAEAIDMKAHAMEYNRQMLNNMANRLSNVRSNYTKVADQVERDANDIAAKVAGANTAEAKASDIYTVTHDKYVEDNQPTIVDPLDLAKVITELANETDTFVTKIDSALSVINATTVIEITYDA